MHINESIPGKRVNSQQANARKWKSTDAPSEQVRIPSSLKIGENQDSINQQSKETDSQNVWPSGIFSILQQTMATPGHHPSNPIFEFDMSVEAAKNNYMILMHKFGGDLHKALEAQHGSPLQYGSKFKPVSILALIFSNHPTWDKMMTLLSDGSTWPLSPIDNHDRLLDIDNALDFGNHKGANQQPELLLKLINDDVIRGFALPLPLEKIRKIPGILLTPLNIQQQNTINE